MTRFAKHDHRFSIFGILVRWDSCWSLCLAAYASNGLSLPQRTPRTPRTLRKHRSRPGTLALRRVPRLLVIWKFHTEATEHTEETEFTRPPNGRLCMLCT